MAFEIQAEKIKTIHYQQIDIWKEGISRRNCGKKNVALVGKHRVDLTWQECRIHVSFSNICICAELLFILSSYSIIHSSNITDHLLCTRLCSLAVRTLIESLLPGDLQHSSENKQ